MNPDWQAISSRLLAYPPRVHRLLPPCDEKRLEFIQKQLGKLPDPLVDMLHCFNGAKLFIRTAPLLSIFRISTVEPLPPLEWASDWCIDKFTPLWRRYGDRQNDWAIAMMNYGGLIILDSGCIVKEWDTSQKMWNPGKLEFDKWIDKILAEGDAYMKEE
ncbi:MAG TPA: SMI1/KNR4 family protein [Phycisphaerae bacterium]|nr:SMI1/KNR4 family protein [Phycisphaerae bacterium]